MCNQGKVHPPYLIQNSKLNLQSLDPRLVSHGLTYLSTPYYKELKFSGEEPQ